MTKYELIFTLPYKLGAYDHVTLNERLERELQSYFDNRSIKAILVDDDTERQPRPLRRCDTEGDEN